MAVGQMDGAAKSMIDFSNETSKFDVYGLSLEVYRLDEGLEVVVPRPYPQSPPEPERPSTTWNRCTFLEDARKRVPGYVGALEGACSFQGKRGLEVGRWQEVRLVRESTSTTFSAGGPCSGVLKRASNDLLRELVSARAFR
jgi:hypothetical protein